MNLLIYSDESGVFDKEHNKYFVFGGLIFLSKNEKEIQARKYSSVEKNIRKASSHYKNIELKASVLEAKHKGSIYRSLNSCIKFAGIVNQANVTSEIYDNKKTKQRYMDYVFKISLKRALEHLISDGKIIPDEVENMHLYSDEHSTATNGRYELKESLEKEFKLGVVNFERMRYFPPLFKKMQSLELNFCDSKTTTLVRAADIVANNIYHKVVTEKELITDPSKNLYITYFP